MDNPPPYDEGGKYPNEKDDAFDSDETRYALLKSIESAAGAQDFVNAMSMELLLDESCDWGALLSHAPRALCSMGQCFVIASTPLASSISLADSKNLQ